MRESELLSHIADRSADLAGAASALGEIAVGPGDDAAVVRLGDGTQLLITVDQLVVGRHVEPDAPIDLIARKAIAIPDDMYTELSSQVISEFSI